MAMLTSSASARPPGTQEEHRHPGGALALKGTRDGLVPVLATGQATWAGKVCFRDLLSPNFSFCICTCWQMSGNRPMDHDLPRR